MKSLIITCVLLLLSSPSYTSRIEVQYDQDLNQLLIIVKGKENLEEITIYSNKELLTSFIPLTDTIKIKRECPVAGKIRYVVKLRSGLVVDDYRRRKSDLKCTGSFIEINEPKE